MGVELMIVVAVVVALNVGVVVVVGEVVPVEETDVVVVGVVDGDDVTVVEVAVDVNEDVPVVDGDVDMLVLGLLVPEDEAVLVGVLVMVVVVAVVDTLVVAVEVWLDVAVVDSVDVSVEVWDVVGVVFKQVLTPPSPYERTAPFSTATSLSHAFKPADAKYVPSTHERLPLVPCGPVNASITSFKS